MEARGPATKGPDLSTRVRWLARRCTACRAWPTSRHMACVTAALASAAFPTVGQAAVSCLQSGGSAPRTWGEEGDAVLQVAG